MAWLKMVEVGMGRLAAGCPVLGYVPRHIADYRYADLSGHVNGAVIVPTAPGIMEDRRRVLFYRTLHGPLALCQLNRSGRSHSGITLLMFNTAEANQQDIQNYTISRSALGEAAEIPDRIAGLYDLVYKSILPTINTDSRQAAATLCLTLNAKHLVLGITSLYRLHAAQMFRELRSACEATGIAYLILTNAKAYEVFAKDRVTDEKARKQAKHLFTPRNIFSEDNPHLKQLNKCYADASTRAHTNLMSSMRHVVPILGREESAFSYTDITTQHTELTVKTYLRWSCSVHLAILDTVVTIIFPEFDAGQPAFRQSLDAIDHFLDHFTEHVASLDRKRQ